MTDGKIEIILLIFNWNFQKKVKKFIILNLCVCGKRREDF